MTSNLKDAPSLVEKYWKCRVPILSTDGDVGGIDRNEHDAAAGQPDPLRSRIGFFHDWFSLGVTGTLDAAPPDHRCDVLGPSGRHYNYAGPAQARFARQSGQVPGLDQLFV